MKLKVRGVQAKTSFKDGLGCILKSFGCKGDVDFAPLPMYYDYEVFPVRFVYTGGTVPLFATPKLAKKVSRKGVTVAKRGCCEKGDL